MPRQHTIESVAFNDPDEFLVEDKIKAPKSDAEAERTVLRDLLQHLFEDPYGGLCSIASSLGSSLVAPDYNSIVPRPAFGFRCSLSLPSIFALAFFRNSEVQQLWLCVCVVH